MCTEYEINRLIPTHTHLFKKTNTHTPINITQERDDNPTDPTTPTHTPIYLFLF